MSELRIAGNNIPSPFGPPSQFGHMQIVYYDDFGNNFEIEVQAPNELFSGFWDIRPTDRRHDNEFDMDGRDNTPYYTDGSNNDNYRSILLATDASADAMWNILSQVTIQFNQATVNNPFEYDVDYNSNTYVNTLMNIIGINIFQPGTINGQSIIEVLEDGGNVLQGYPGAPRNALFDLEYPNDAIDLNIQMMQLT